VDYLKLFIITANAYLNKTSIAEAGIYQNKSQPKWLARIKLS
jgi:hypothetical protein